MIGFSLIASSISSEQFIGEVGWGYKYGMAVANWEWLVWLAQGLLHFNISASPSGSWTFTILCGGIREE